MNHELYTLKREPNKTERETLNHGAFCRSEEVSRACMISWVQPNPAPVRVTDSLQKSNTATINLLNETCSRQLVSCNYHEFAKSHSLL